jgi:hypothetical protein
MRRRRRITATDPPIAPPIIGPVWPGSPPIIVPV